jgi:hypothetical protein
MACWRYPCFCTTKRCFHHSKDGKRLLLSAWKNHNPDKNDLPERIPLPAYHRPPSEPKSTPSLKRPRQVPSQLESQEWIASRKILIGLISSFKFPISSSYRSALLHLIRLLACLQYLEQTESSSLSTPSSSSPAFLPSRSSVTPGRSARPVSPRLS